MLQYKNYLINKGKMVLLKLKNCYFNQNISLNSQIESIWHLAIVKLRLKSMALNDLDVGG